MRATFASSVAFVLVAFLPLTALGAGTVVLRLDEKPGATGKYLIGVHFTYCYEGDDIYADGSFAEWARRAGVAVARYPGGTVVHYWDWRNPTGYLKEDPWDDPAARRAPPSRWMSLDEYLQFIDASGAVPLIGVNMLSGVRNDRVADSVARAVEQVKYVVSKGYPGAFYYLGNEDIAKMGGLEAAAEIFARHAKAMKRADPSARLLWNDDYVNESRLRTFLEIAGEYADGVEFHGKWAGQGGDGKISRAEWQRQYPFNVANRGRFSERALELRRSAVELGYPDLLIASNEYGLAPSGHERFEGFDRYTFGLVAIEFLQDLFVGRFDMAAFWSNVPSARPGKAARGARRVIDVDAGNRLNPFHLGLELLASAQGRQLVGIEGGGPGGYGFATLSEDRLELFLLNKSSEESRVDVRLAGTTAGAMAIGPAGAMTSLVDTPDHWGTLERTPVRVESGSVRVVLPRLSYSKIVLPVARTGEPR